MDDFEERLKRLFPRGTGVDRARECLGIRRIWEDRAKVNLKFRYHLASKNVIVDIAPLSRIIDGENFSKDTRVYYRLLNKDSKLFKLK